MSRTVVQQFYQTRVIDEFVLRGNSALLKCNLPSFVADFVAIDAWLSDDGIEYRPSIDDFGSSQMLFVRMCRHQIQCATAWPRPPSNFLFYVLQHFVFTHHNHPHPVVSQFYESQVYDEYVIKGNPAVLKCNIPSFVSDHVEIVEWLDSNGGQYFRETASYGSDVSIALRLVFYDL